ncbi:MAG: SRPBCC domain-containing protein [Ignavibacteriales bacterium]|nr:SRPBCC domain-containing protein [Ignavibacteriales bacterium]
MKVNDELIIVEQILDVSIESVWNSLTEIGEMHKWYFDNIPEFKPEVGFETQFNIKSEERNFLHHWKVIEVEPLKKIKYRWTFENYPGKSTSAFELSRENNLTKLRLTVEVLEDFPDEIPEFERESCIGGWNYFINNRLRDYLKNK